ncbi:transmembrane protein 82-like [Synchiropus picturatus]
MTETPKKRPMCVVGTCGISVLCNLIRVSIFAQSRSDGDDGHGPCSSPASILHTSKWRSAVQFWSVALLLPLVGPRVSSLIVLEFCLRAVSAKFSSRPVNADYDGNVELLLLQSQFSLGCALSCTLLFLHQEALNSTYCLFLATALSWALAGYCHSLWNHVARLFPLHSVERSCGKCVSLLTSGHSLLASLQRLVILVFALAAVACASIVCDNFFHQPDALKLWTPLTLCYTLLLVYIQEGQRGQTPAEALLHNVLLRLGALLVLMLTVGHWSDVLHVLLAVLGEAVCLLPSNDLLQIAFQKECEDIHLQKIQLSSRDRKRKHSSDVSSKSDR